METYFEEILDNINENGDLDAKATAEAKARQNVLAKPTGALGELEDISVRLAGISGQVKNKIAKKAIVITAADNGVVEEGVASAPQSVTRSQTINFTRRLTGVGAMAKHFDIDLLVIDIGVKLPIPRKYYTESMVEDDRLTNKIFDNKLAKGTANLAAGAFGSFLRL